jgi:hypothetical protein
MVHCSLVDVEECYSSPFEILGDPITSNTTSNDRGDTELHTRAFRVDNSGRTILIEMARSNGDCGTCSGSSVSDSSPLISAGFRAEIRGTVSALSSNDGNGYVPVQIQITNASRSNNQATICGVTRAIPSQPPTSNRPVEDAPKKKQSNNVGITVLSVAVVLIALSLASMSMYFAFAGRCRSSISYSKQNVKTTKNNYYASIHSART